MHDEHCTLAVRDGHVVCLEPHTGQRIPNEMLVGEGYWGPCAYPAGGHGHTRMAMRHVLYTATYCPKHRKILLDSEM